MSNIGLNPARNAKYLRIFTDIDQYLPYYNLKFNMFAYTLPLIHQDFLLNSCIPTRISGLFASYSTKIPEFYASYPQIPGKDAINPNIYALYLKI